MGLQGEIRDWVASNTKPEWLWWAQIGCDGLSTERCNDYDDIFSSCETNSHVNFMYGCFWEFAIGANGR